MTLVTNSIYSIADLLKQSGLEVCKINEENGEITCRCPFHQDKTPSLDVNAYSGKYLCRAGCVAGYSIKDLIYKVTGREVENIIREPISIVPKKVKRIIPSVPVLNLALYNEGQIFLNKRGINDASIREWSITWWLEQRAIVIPVYNVGYVLRFIDATETKNKYKYVAGTRITDGFFGFDKLDESENSVILVEGALDAVFLRQLGFKNSLGLMHNDISEKQIKLLASLGNSIKVFIMLDNDEGGRSGAEKIEKKLKNHFITKNCILPMGKDPNQCNKIEIEKSLKGE